MKRSFQTSIVLISAAFLTVGCMNDDPLERQPESICDDIFNTNRLPLPATKKYDLNKDGVDDLEIFQAIHPIDSPIGSSRFMTFINPLGANQLLMPSGNGFLDKGYKLHLSSGDLVWNHGQQVFIKADGCKGLYQSKCDVVFPTGNNPFHGFIIRSNEIVQIAWLKLNIDRTSGKIELVDYAISNSESIVVGEH